MSKKFCYLFTEGNAKMRELLGGKGANLAEMTNIGLPVPQGFTITTEACTQYYEDGRQINAEIMAEIMEYIEKMEEITGKKFGDLENPLLVSVRSGARASMPGMMDTILNLGLNEEVVDVIAKKSEQPPLGVGLLPPLYPDVLRRGHGGGQEVLRAAHRPDEGRPKGVTQDVELTAEDLKELAEQFKAEYKAKIGEDFPTDPKEQLMGADQGRVPLLGQPPRQRLPPRRTTSPTPGAPPSTSSPWPSATWATTAAPAWPSPATPPPARRSSWASS